MNYQTKAWRSQSFEWQCLYQKYEGMDHYYTNDLVFRTYCKHPDCFKIQMLLNLIISIEDVTDDSFVNLPLDIQ